MSISKFIEKKKREQKKKENLKKAKIAGITALGASAGALAGLLFAPKSGKETRNDIVEKTKDVKTDVSRKTSEIKGNISEKVTQGKSNINEAKEKISEYLQNKKKEKCSEETIEISEEAASDCETKVEGEL